MFHTPKKQLIPYSRVLPQKLTVPQLVEEFSAVYGTQIFIRVFTIAHNV
jgi:hypothetical protein